MMFDIMNQRNYKLEYIERQVSELQLIRCSLLPDEHFALLDSNWGHFPSDLGDNGGDSEFPFWKKALESYADYELPSAFLESIDLCAAVASPPSFELKVDGAKIWFQVTLPSTKASSLNEVGDTSEPDISVDHLQGATVSVKGENITRAEQEEWQGVIMEKTKEIDDSEFPTYQLLSLHLLPRLRENIESLSQGSSSGIPKNGTPITESETYHVLFTSHHLISPTKRRSLQHWSSSLSLSGFAKVGYPGVIYAEGERSDIEEFVGNVKGMNWLGLRLRFLEPLDLMKPPSKTERRWAEFQKVGEVVEEMRRIGREEHIVEMGIGSLGSHNTSV